MTELKLANYAYLWDGTQPGWVLLKSADDPSHLIIFNELGQSMLLVEDEELRNALVAAMLAADLPVRDMSTMTARDVEVTPGPPTRER